MEPLTTVLWHSPPAAVATGTQGLRSLRPDSRFARYLSAPGLELPGLRRTLVKHSKRTTRRVHVDAENGGT